MSRIGPFAQTIGAVIRKLRKDRGLSQLGLATASGVRQSALSRIESGTQGASVDQLKLLGGVLGVAPSQIVQIADDWSRALSSCLDSPAPKA